MKLQQKSRFLRAAAGIILGAAAALPSQALEAFRAPRIAPVELVHLAAPLEKSGGARVEAGRLRIGDVRAVPKATRELPWTPAAGGFVARFSVTSESAQGIRVQLDLGVVPGAMEVRAQGADATQVETMTLDPLLGTKAWTPWTEGETQTVEIFSAVLPSARAITIGSISHFIDSPLAKAGSASCTLSTACPIDDPTTQALVAERKKSVIRIIYERPNGSFQCSATLIDTPLRPAAYVLTANHCIDDMSSASSINSFWFFEESSCGSNVAASTAVRRNTGMQLVFTSYNVDSTLLLMATTPPPGALYSPINPAVLPNGTSVLSISHPHGDYARWSAGTAGPQFIDGERPYSMYSVNFSQGIIEPGSSGSGIFTNSGGHLALRGILSQMAEDLSCAQPTLFTLSARLEAFYPQIAQYIGATSVGLDDAPNRFQEVTTAVSAAPLDNLAAPVEIANRQINYPGDVDFYRFTVAQASAVTARTTGSTDTVATLYDSTGHALLAQDDAQVGDTNAGITSYLAAGTYYFGVGHWDPSGIGAYGVSLRADHVGADNYTALWWNAAESGWGVNVVHQGNTLFATLFTYDTDGSPLWLIMSEGKRQADGSYLGKLYTTTGPAFNSVPWGPYELHEKGTMRFTFSGLDSGALVYTYNGVTVAKNITRLSFIGVPPTCHWSAFDRSASFNFQDLWINPAEPGWGINIAHQEDTLFATIFTYDAQRQPLWFVMSNGARVTGSTANAPVYRGTLFTTTGPAFNSNPWPGPPVYHDVGQLTLTFTNGNAATIAYTVNGAPVTKQIQRFAFGTPAADCE